MYDTKDSKEYYLAHRYLDSMSRYLGGIYFDIQNKAIKKELIFISELAYSFHLGSNKNRKNSVRNSAKNNLSETTSMTNNGIQDAKTLSKCDKHNYRKYDNEQEQIVIVRGTSSLYEDVQNFYKTVFEEARIEYNNKQTRDDRKINDYFRKVSEN